jgi:ATP-binding cassette, subfamily B, multidrug efflux pump
MKELFFLNKYFYKYRGRFILGTVFIIISNVFSIFPAVYVRQGFDTVTRAIEDFQSLQSALQISDLKFTLLKYGMLIIAMSLARGVFMFFMRQTIIVMSRLIEFDLKNEVYKQYQSLSIAFYNRNKTGDLMNRISEDVSRVRMYLGPAVMYTISVVSQIILVVAVMLSINVKLTIYALLPLPVLSVAIYYVSNIINQRSERVQEQLSNISTLAQETFSGIRVVKAYIQESRIKGKMQVDSEEYKKRSLSLVKVNALFFPLMILLIGLSTLLTIYIGGILALRGEITTGNIAEFVIYVNMLTWPVASLGWVTSIVQSAEASQRRINEFLKITPEIENPTEENFELEGRITFEEVEFVYPDSGIQALKKVSFELKPGKSLAIVGKTGSGKSTAAHLIGRLYDVSAGRVLVDGKDIRTINLNVLRENIGYVPQEGFLFSDSIQKNILFGVDKDELKEVKQAAADADILENILSFKEGLDTRVGERGITLSGGQKQRVSIARALMRNPKILILDDCLSAVDTQTEENILNNLKRVMEKKTTLIISHRISSIKHCDEIIVLSKGAVIERGSHESLIEKQGYYAELYRKQQLEKEFSAPIA